MARNQKPIRPDSEDKRFAGFRSPNDLTDLPSDEKDPEARHSESDTQFIQSALDPYSRCRVCVGFEMVSCATPANALQQQGGTVNGVPCFPGELTLSNDIRLALEPFSRELPNDSALIAEYLFSPDGAGTVRLRFRILVESQRLVFGEAYEQARTLQEELAICLRVLSDWYAFSRVSFTDHDKQVWSGSIVRLKLKSRLFSTSASAAGIGFSSSKSNDTAPQLLLPQPASGEAHFVDRSLASKALLLNSNGRGCLDGSLRASRGLLDEMPIRIVLRRRDLMANELNELQLISGRVSANGLTDSVIDQPLQTTGLAGDAARLAIEQLVAQPKCLEVSFESRDVNATDRSWLRILGQEMFPAFITEVSATGIQKKTRGHQAEPGKHIDLSQLLSPDSRIPPFFPAPGFLDSINFARHFPNPIVSFPDDGLVLGKTQIGGVDVDVRMPQSDRSRHTYVLGATGTGKSTLIYNMAVQDIADGRGLAVLDPHGDLYDQLLLAIPPERKGDLILIDLDDERFQPCLNPLDFGGKPSLDGASRVASDMLELFSQIYDMKAVGGPGFEDYFRHSLLLAASAPRGGPERENGPVPSLSSIVHVLRDPDWREYLLAKAEGVYGPEGATLLKQFFASAIRTTGDQALTNWVPYVNSKLSRFTSNTTLRRLFCAGPKTLDFRAAMDQRKILLINLSKGNLGTGDSRFIGMLLVKAIFAAALSRSDIPRKDRAAFYLYLDEFQNFVTPDIADMLAEARKYELRLVLANQTLSQLMTGGRRETLDAVLGNVATRLFFRVGSHEAKQIEEGFTPYFDATTLSHIPDRHVLSRILLANQPSLPFVFKTLPANQPPIGASSARSEEWACGKEQS